MTRMTRIIFLFILDRYILTWVQYKEQSNYNSSPKLGEVAFRPEESVNRQTLQTYALPLRVAYGLRRTEHCTPLAAARMDI